MSLYTFNTKESESISVEGTSEQNAFFSNLNLIKDGTIIKNIDLSEHELFYITFTNVDFININFNKSNYDSINFNNCTFRNINFTDSNLTNISFNNCYFENFNLNYSIIDGISFNQCDFNEMVNLQSSRITNTLFDNINTKFLKLSDAEIFTTTFTNCNMYFNNKDLLMYLLKKHAIEEYQMEYVEYAKNKVYNEHWCWKDFQNNLDILPQDGFLWSWNVFREYINDFEIVESDIREKIINNTIE